MKQNDLALLKWIDEFAKQGYVTINRGKHLPFLFDIKIFSMKGSHHLSIIRLDYRPDSYECATACEDTHQVSDPVNLYSIEEVQDWCNTHQDFLDK